MAMIVHAEIVGTRMAQEGAGGYTVNSTSYSVLVFYDNGACELVEGSTSQIRSYLPYMKPMNNSAQLMNLLNQFKQDLPNIVKSAVMESLYQLPKGIIGSRAKEAKKLIEEKGFNVEFTSYVADTADGVVVEVKRKANDPMTVILKIQYNVPNVIGKNRVLAEQIIRSAGLSPLIHKIRQATAEQDTVLSIDSKIGDSTVILNVCDNTINNFGMNKAKVMKILTTGGEAIFKSDAVGKCDLCNKRDIPVSHVVIHEEFAIKNRVVCKECFEKTRTEISAQQ